MIDEETRTHDDVSEKHKFSVINSLLMWRATYLIKPVNVMELKVDVYQDLMRSLRSYAVEIHSSISVSEFSTTLLRESQFSIAILHLF